MPENEILQEIRRAREQLGEAADFDVNKLFVLVRQETDQLLATGWKTLTAPERHSAREPESPVVREEPPQPPPEP